MKRSPKLIVIKRQALGCSWRLCNPPWAQWEFKILFIKLYCPKFMFFFHVEPWKNNPAQSFWFTWSLPTNTRTQTGCSRSPCLVPSAGSWLSYFSIQKIPIHGHFCLPSQKQLMKIGSAKLYPNQYLSCGRVLRKN